MSWQDDIDNTYQPMVDTLITNIATITDYQTWLNALGGSCTASDLRTAIDSSTFVQNSIGLNNSLVSETAPDEDIQTWITNEKSWCTTVLTKMNTSKTSIESTIIDLETKIAAGTPYPA